MILIARSILGYNSGRPIVEIVVGQEEVQMGVFEARSFALNILSAADAAESDFAVFGWATEEVGMKVGEAAAIIQTLRAKRARLGETVPGSTPVYQPPNIDTGPTEGQ